MQLRKTVFFLGVVGVTTVFAIGSFGRPLSDLSTVAEKIQICRNGTCYNEVEWSEKYNTNLAQTNKLDVIGILTLVIMGFIPSSGFIWWLINNQQEKKITEFSLKQEDTHKTLISTLLDKQEETAKVFTDELKSVAHKLDTISKTINDNKLEYVEKAYQQELHVLTVENNLNTLTTKIRNIENYLNKQENFYIRD